MILKKYIKNLLYKYDCVIVPGFGGFVKNPTSAQVNHLNLTISPPSAKISFNINLQNNDGLLVNYVSENEEISYTAALQKVNECVEKIQVELNESKNVEIEGVGIFYLDSNKKLIFNQSKEYNFLTESFGLYPVLAIPIEREKMPEKIKREIKSASIRAQKNTSKRKRYWVVVLPILILLAILPVLKPEWFVATQYSDMLPFSFLKNSVYTERIEHYYDKQDVEGVFDFKKELSKISDTTNYTLLPLFEGGKSMPIKLKAAEAVTTYVKKSESILPGRYYVVGGCFAIQENAESFLKKLQLEGYNAAIVGKRNDLYTVVYGTFSSRKHAAEELKKVRQNNTSAWLLKN
jgi:hypothetical protein